jgi:hypothetical protein
LLAFTEETPLHYTRPRAVDSFNRKLDSSYFPDGLLEDPSLPDAAIRVAVILGRKTDREASDVAAWRIDSAPTHVQIAKWCGWDDPRTVRRAISDLRNAGWLVHRKVSFTGPLAYFFRPKQLAFSDAPKRTEMSGSKRTEMSGSKRTEMSASKRTEMSGSNEPALDDRASVRAGAPLVSKLVSIKKQTNGGDAQLLERTYAMSTQNAEAIAAGLLDPIDSWIDCIERTNKDPKKRDVDDETLFLLNAVRLQWRLPRWYHKAIEREARQMELRAVNDIEKRLEKPLEKPPQAQDDRTAEERRAIAFAALPENMRRKVAAS